MRDHVTLRSRIPPEILVFVKAAQKDRGGCFPPNGGKNERSVTSRSQIVPKILLFAKTFQKGRGTQNVPNGTKNEREVNTFEFIFLRVENPFRVENTVNQKTNAHRGV